MTPQTPEQIAGKLGTAHLRFLNDVTNGRKPICADREEDKVRQKLRRLGLVEVVKNPRRWSITVTGLQVRAILRGEHDR